MNDISYDGLTGYLKVGRSYNLYMVNGSIYTIKVKQLIVDHIGNPVAIISDEDGIYNWSNILHANRTTRVVNK